MITIILSVLSLATSVTALYTSIRTDKALKRTDKGLALQRLKTELGVEEITEAL